MRMLPKSPSAMMNLLCVCLFSLTSVWADIGPDNVVTTTKGRVQGMQVMIITITITIIIIIIMMQVMTAHGRRVSAWLGIPYAQPPVGNLR